MEVRNLWYTARGYIPAGLRQSRAGKPHPSPITFRRSHHHGHGHGHGRTTVKYSDLPSEFELRVWDLVLLVVSLRAMAWCHTWVLGSTAYSPMRC